MIEIFRGMENGAEAINQNIKEIDGRVDGQNEAIDRFKSDTQKALKDLNLDGKNVNLNDLFVAGHLNGRITREVVSIGFADAIFWRFGPVVVMYVAGDYGSRYTFPWGWMGDFQVPAGYRPTEKTPVTVLNDFHSSTATIDWGGGLMATDTEFNNKTKIEIFGTWLTGNDFRI